MDKYNIKDLLNQTFVSEGKVPGIDVTNASKKESEKVNKKAIKDMEKELSDYDKDSKKETKDAKKPVKFNYTDDSEAEYHQEMEIMNGQEMIQYDRTPSEEYAKRAEEAIEGSSRMGNNPEWANVVIPGQGGDPTFGKKLVKAIKASAKKRSDNTPTSKMFGDDWEVVKDHSHKPYAMENKVDNKKTIKETEKMKKITFKKPFNGINNALTLIPESYKVDNKVFFITDGNESYKIRWEGPLNEGKAIVLIASDSTLVNEDVQKMKHLMGYKSSETLGLVKGNSRINENAAFGDIWKKTKSILNENMDEGIYEMNGSQEPGEVGSAQNEPVNISTMRALFMDILKDFGEVSPKEKISFYNFVQLLFKFFREPGNQDSGQSGNIMNKFEMLMNKKLEKEPIGLQPGNPEPTATPIPETKMSRFDEIFSGSDEE